MVWATLALPGVILNGPIFIIASVISKKKAQGKQHSGVGVMAHFSPCHAEAFAASVVKVAGRDVLATWKILISLGIAPVLYTFYAILATVVAVKANNSLSLQLWTPFLVICALPFMNYAALKFGEAGVDVFK